MGRTKYNYLGEVLTSDSMFIPVDDSFFDKEGNPLWRENIQNGDDFGFDLLNKEENEKHIISVVLPSGKKVVRYGEPGGSCTTDEGEQFEGISLPYLKESLHIMSILLWRIRRSSVMLIKEKLLRGLDIKEEQFSTDTILRYMNLSCRGF